MTDILVNIKSLFGSQGKDLVLLLIIALGAILPQLHIFTFLIQFLLMIMRFSGLHQPYLVGGSDVSRPVPSHL
jgi:hypothetical protein